MTSSRVETFTTYSWLLKPVAPVQLVDQIRHPLEPVGDHAQPIFAEVLCLDAERTRERLHHVVGRHGTVPVHEVVQVSRGEPRLLGQRPVRQTRLVHQPLDSRAERVVAEPPLPRHQFDFSRIAATRSSSFTAWSSPFVRSRRSTVPSSEAFRPTVTRNGQPIKSASANFSPARASRSSSSTSKPASSRADAAASAYSSVPGSATMCTSYGATERGQAIPRSS